MCLLFMQKDNTRTFTVEEFNEAWRTNRDGFWMYISDEFWNVTIFKSLNLQESINAYFEAIAKPYTILIGHFRWWTAWPKNEHLVHPFNLNKSTYLFHNWIISITPREGESDTSELALFFSESRTPTNKIFTTTFVEIMLKIAGGSNKFIIANGRDYFIINEKLWHWDWNSWYSNSWYKVYTPLLNWGKKKVDDDWIDESVGEISIKSSKQIEDERYERVADEDVSLPMWLKGGI